ncbi:hypothetical protein [Minwuia sp.]|uniref:hypothetical protein n=1 Tax=Minwuia sp. TaxID=2493630 RepID=UPI003A94AC20
MLGDDRIELLVGWVLTAVYLLWFSKKYFDSAPYSTARSRADAAEPLENALAAQPIYPRFAAPSRQYWTWFLLFFAYVWCLYFIVQMVLDSAMLGDAALGDLESNVWVSTFPQLLAALIIFGGVDRIPQLSRALSTVRNMFHESASIPRRARMMINSVRVFPKQFSQNEIAMAAKISSFVRDDDGDFPPGSTEYKFLYACFLLSTIERRANTNRAYDRFIDDPDSGYAGTRSQLDYVEKIIAGNLRNEDTRFHGDATDRIVDALFRNATQLYVSATVTASRRFSKTIRNIVQDGVPIQIYREFRFQIGHALVANILVLVVLFFALFLGFTIWQSPDITAPPAVAAARSVLATVLVVTIPVISTYMLKVAAVDEWPLGFDGQERGDNLPKYALASLIGMAAALIGFYVMAEYDLLDEDAGFDWFLGVAPWAGVPGVICFLAAATLDHIPRRYAFSRYISHALATGLAGAVGCAIVGFIIQMVAHESELPGLMDPQSPFWERALSLIFSATAVGFLFGMYISVISDLGTRLPKTMTIGEHYFFRFLLGQVLASETPREAWSGMWIDTNDLPSQEVVEVLIEEGFLSADRTLTPKAVDRLFAT